MYVPVFPEVLVSVMVFALANSEILPSIVGTVPVLRKVYEGVEATASGAGRPPAGPDDGAEADGALITSENDGALCVTLPPVALTIIDEYVPTGVEAVVVIVIVVEHDVFGMHDAGLNDALAPEGSPVTFVGENDTDCAVPPVSVTLIVLLVDPP